MTRLRCTGFENLSMLQVQAVRNDNGPRKSKPVTVDWNPRAFSERNVVLLQAFFAFIAFIAFLGGAASSCLAAFFIAFLAILSGAGERDKWCWIKLKCLGQSRL